MWKMFTSNKRARHSQSDVEVTLSIENVSKIYQKSAPDPHQVHPCCSLVASLLLPLPLVVPSPNHVGGLWTLRGSRKSVYNLFMGSFGPILVPTWTQLGPNLDPTWTQLGPNLALIPANM